jgi:transcriptional regulator GlxA family with amidase domain
VFHSAGVIWNWLHGAAPKPRFQVNVASIDGRGVTSLCGLGLKPACALKDIVKTDIIIPPASGWDVIGVISRNSKLTSWLRKWHSRGAYIAGICTGVAFLVECGFLDGRRATTHWGVAQIFRERYPKVDWRTDQFVTEDGRLLCSGGVYASIDLSLYLVEKFCGRDIAIETAKSLLLSMPRNRQSGYSVLPLSRPHADEKIRQAEDYLQENFACGVSVEMLAAQSAMGQRNFIRRFKAATGRLPSAYLQMLRVNADKAMLEDGPASVQSICSNVGYDDLAFFRTIFRRHTGMTPTEYRGSFSRSGYERRQLVAGQ